MGRVRVVLHIQISLDAKADGFEVDMGTYYRLAEKFAPDAILSGADTILKAPIPEEVPDWSYQVAANFPSCSRCLMAIVDSRGRVRNWRAIKRQPFWKTPLALCSRSTPREYIDHLESEGIEHIMTGEDKVDLREALQEMGDRYGVRTVRVDSGGVLSTVLLEKGLVDEISVLLSPCLVGGLSDNALIRQGMMRWERCIQLKLEQIEQLDAGLVWLRYSVI